ncbi:putative two-component system sensor kinase [Actinoplanes missouriensis 431]|uniref:histidine kinase n=1 Tax=Actinoplanes missouriensis (strain ATCC 14538 / DSM 43046 / CBS 188.64 / JCM 3121 / NBRC 102363 / NCIMB 12654 / NRRL B-3342 / UNCC 431) TaxID=512565 RepID=I0HJH9_ACTM4|nr:ATP-binding protein [Actinoplanes missouriensis]BAL93166.1 putative two-component system sensor kinase [Actinoplanes missouriensis 431]
MRLGSPLRRAALVCVLLMTGAYLSREAAEGMGDWMRRAVYRLCVGADGSVSPTVACRAGVEVDNSYRLMLMVVFLVLAVAALFGLRWAVGPIRELATQIRSLGPQNFAYRIRSGSRRGEMAELADAVNDMISRVAVGYESQRRFAADASHELRTPLAVQRTLIEVGLARGPSPEKLAVLTEQLLETNERNVRLIEALLVLSESDRGLASRSALRLDEIAGAVVAEHHSRAAQSHLTISTDLRPRVVIGERVLLERLITNLVQNAIKYNRPGGTITVTVGDDPALIVENTGDDVPPETVAGLFEPFRRLNGARIDHSGGVGLGLTIARSIVHAHDGAITGTSAGRDGLRIDVTFPEA